MNTLTIYRVFEDAFSEDSVSFEKNPPLHLKRWLSLGVDFELSYGVKSEGVLVAALLHAPRNKLLFNLATGVRKDFRGFGLTYLMYQKIEEDLPPKNFEKMKLEVITENIRAIKSYEKAGFRKTRKLLSWKGTASTFSPSEGDHKIHAPKLTPEHFPLSPYPYSFEMDEVGILRQTETLELHELRVDEKLLAYAVWNPWKMNLVQLGGVNRKWVVGLLNKMKLSGETFGAVKMDDKNELLSEIFQDHGMINFISQYEMERNV